MSASPESMDRLIDELLAKIAAPAHQAKKSLPHPRFTTYLENLGWVQPAARRRAQTCALRYHRVLELHALRTALNLQKYALVFWKLAGISSLLISSSSLYRAREAAVFCFTG